MLGMLSLASAGVDGQNHCPHESDIFNHFHPFLGKNWE